MNRRTAVIAAYLPFVALPALIGIFGVVHGMIASMSVVAFAGSSPKPSEIAAGISMSLFSALVGMMVSFPSFMVVASGLFVRAVNYVPATDPGGEPLKQS
jgi:biopolymer transport protein ExbB/TolQ